MSRLEQAKRAAAICGFGGLLYKMVSILLANIPLPSMSDAQNLLAGMLINSIALAAPFLLLVIQPMQGGGLCVKRPCKSTAMPLFLLFWAMVWAGTGAAWMLEKLLGKTSAAVTLQQGPLLILQWVSLAIVPAVGEELLFRGLLQGYLRPYGGWIAIVGQAVIFSLLHGQAQNCLAALFGGIALGLCAEYSGSLFVGMAFHLYNNTAAFVGQYNRQFGTAQPLAVALDFIIPAAVLAIYLVRYCTHKTPKLQKLPSEVATVQLVHSGGWVISVLILTGYMIMQTMT